MRALWFVFFIALLAGAVLAFPPNAPPGGWPIRQPRSVSDYLAGMPVRASEGREPAWFDVDEQEIGTEACPKVGNFTAYSDEFDRTVANVAWTRTGTGVAAPTVTANQGDAPDGGMTADRVVFAACPTSGNQSTLTSRLGGELLSSMRLPATAGVWIRGFPGGATPNSGSISIAFRHISGATSRGKQCAFTDQWSYCSLSELPAANGSDYLFIPDEMLVGCLNAASFNAATNTGAADVLLASGHAYPDTEPWQYVRTVAFADGNGQPLTGFFGQPIITQQAGVSVCDRSNGFTGIQPGDIYPHPPYAAKRMKLWGDKVGLYVSPGRANTVATAASSGGSCRTLGFTLASGCTGTSCVAPAAPSRLEFPGTLTPNSTYGATRYTFPPCNAAPATTQWSTATQNISTVCTKVFSVYIKGVDGGSGTIPMFQYATSPSVSGVVTQCAYNSDSWTRCYISSGVNGLPTGVTSTFLGLGCDTRFGATGNADPVTVDLWGYVSECAAPSGPGVMPDGGFWRPLVHQPRNCEGIQQGTANTAWQLDFGTTGDAGTLGGISMAMDMAWVTEARPPVHNTASPALAVASSVINATAALCANSANACFGLSSGVSQSGIDAGVWGRNDGGLWNATPSGPFPASAWAGWATAGGVNATIDGTPRTPSAAITGSTIVPLRYVNLSRLEGYSASDTAMATNASAFFLYRFCYDRDSTVCRETP